MQGLVVQVQGEGRCLCVYTRSRVLPDHARASCAARAFLGCLSHCPVVSSLEIVTLVFALPAIHVDAQQTCAVGTFALVVLPLATVHHVSIPIHPGLGLRHELQLARPRCATLPVIQ